MSTRVRSGGNDAGWITSTSNENLRCKVSQIGKRETGNKKAIHTCRCITSSIIDSMGAADGACVGDRLVGEGGTAMKSSASEVEGRGAYN